MSPSLAVSGLVTRAAVFVGAFFSVGNPAVPTQVQVIATAGAALVLAVVHLAEHRTVQNADAVAVAAAQTAQAVAGATHNPIAAKVAEVLSPAQMQQAMAAVGSIVEATRSGVVVSAPAGRHEDQAALPTAPAEAPAAPLFTGSDYPTQAIGVIPAVPAQAGGTR